MTIELSHVRRVRIYQEPAGSSTFAIDHSGTIGDFIDLRLNPSSGSLDRNMLTDERLVQRRYETPLDILGAKSCTFAPVVYLRGTGTALDSSAAAPPATPADAFGRMLQAMFGGYASDQGSTAQAGTTTSSIVVDTGHGSRWPSSGGEFVGCNVGNSVYEVREVASRSVDTLSLKAALSAAPAAATEVLNAHTFHLNDDPNLSLQFIVEDAERDSIWWLMGLQGAPSFQFSPGELCTMTANLQGVDWDNDAQIGTPLGGSLGVADYSTDDPGNPIAFLDSELLFCDTTGGTPFTRVVLDQSSISITPNWTFEAQPSTSGVNGVRRFICRPNRPTVNAEIVVPFEVETYWDAWAARTKFAMQLQIGNQAGSIFVISLPTVQITNVQHNDADGIVSQTISLKAMEDEFCADQATTPTRSPIRLGRL